LNVFVLSNLKIWLSVDKNTAFLPLAYFFR